jgi:hypothetical protein
MSFSSELREWVTALKELLREEREKHPIVFWFLITFAFLYAFTQGLQR